MDEAFVPFALDRFSRQSEARTRAGAGLGLSIVAGIATIAGGTVSLTNSPGAGLRIDVSFPAVTVTSTRP
ncbi:ATP-binding protein [Microbacterium sp. CH12i]|uniref:sensor histidine kinase n=1 Tax=Microbacterium sp. CH12i TaxID=1479651 RepID=UPI0006908FB2